MDEKSPAGDRRGYLEVKTGISCLGSEYASGLISQFIRDRHAINVTVISTLTSQSHVSLEHKQLASTALKALLKGIRVLR
eukprot:scaffold830_cov377-Prasinococcus_capsulatus_cf.AAC.16